jgi:hypothetical protein
MQGKYGAAITHFQGVVRLVPPRPTGFTTVLDPHLFLVANQSLVHAYEHEGQWAGVVGSCEAILQRKILLILVPGSSAIYFDALQSICAALERTGRPAEATLYREEYRRLRPKC